MGCIVGYPWLSNDFSLELVEKCALHHVHSCFTRGQERLEILQKDHRDEKSRLQKAGGQGMIQ